MKRGYCESESRDQAAGTGFQVPFLWLVYCRRWMGEDAVGESPMREVGEGGYSHVGEIDAFS